MRLTPPLKTNKMIICTCGCKVKSLRKVWQVTTNDGGEISYQSLCKKCLIQYIKLGVVVDATSGKYDKP